MDPSPDPAAGVQVGRLDRDIDGVGERGFAGIAAEVSAATGRQITYTALIPETNPEDAPGFAEVFASDPATPHRQLAHGAQETLGREPKEFAQYARETAATGIWNT
ncbi:hypothetical protein ACFCXP_21685 [Streptomyces niveus]|uniref:hypothetical protein n=1 Tax=Streptomyces niveus TaxID=193462 RepID=UPI0035E37618